MNQAALSLVIQDKYFQYAPLLHLFDNICSTNLYLSTNKYVPMLSAIVNGTLYNALVFSQNSKGPLAETIDFISFFWSHSHWYVFRCSLKELSLFKVNLSVLSLVAIDKYDQIQNCLIYFKWRWGVCNLRYSRMYVLS